MTITVSILTSVNEEMGKLKLGYTEDRKTVTFDQSHYKPRRKWVFERRVDSFLIHSVIILTNQFVSHCPEPCDQSNRWQACVVIV